MILSAEGKQALEHSYKTDSNHNFPQRYKMVLLKSEGYTAKDIAVILGSNMASVYNWLTRYEAAGIAGLRTKPGQGRKPIWKEHITIVRVAVSRNDSVYHKPVRLLKKTQAKR